MPYRLMHTDLYDDLWFESLSKDAKHLWYYLNICLQANITGVWQYSLQTISLNTRIPRDDLPTLLEELSKKPTDGSPPKICIYPVDYIWITNHLKHQLHTHNPAVLQGIVKRTHTWRNERLVSDFLNYYKNLVKASPSVPKTSPTLI